MPREYTVAPRERIDIESGTVYTFLDGPHHPLKLNDVTDVILRAHTLRKWVIDGGINDDGGSCCIRVNDGCDRIQVIGLSGSGAEHGVRFTQSEHSKILHCELHHNEMEGLLAGGVDYFEAGFNEAHHNGGGDDENDRGHGMYALSYNSAHGQIHDNHCHHNPGSGIQLNGTAEIQGLVTDAHVWNNLLEHNGCQGTPNLSLICVRDSRFRKNTTRGGRGGMRIFRDANGRNSQNNKFFACVFDQEDTSFSCDFIENTRLTYFDKACVVTGPRMTGTRPIVGPIS